MKGRAHSTLGFTLLAACLAVGAAAPPSGVAVGPAWHQLGNKATREVPPQPGAFPSRTAAGERRIQSGQAGMAMIGTMNELGPRALALFADWTDRIAKGEVPSAPPRPHGAERNVVITEWDW